jgi:external thioesterase TEII
MTCMVKTQLFLLHFAGGNCYSFQFLEPLLNNFDIVSLELPGKGRRAREPLIREFDLAAVDLYAQIREKQSMRRFILYGHSMGAYLALRVANMLLRDHIVPSYLIVSGNPGPGIGDDKKRYLLENDELIAELKRLGGAPDELYENKELLDFFIPILKADFEVAERSAIASEIPVEIPIYALMGSEEEKVEEIANWGRFTKSTFRFEILEGGHFFIHKHSDRIAGILNECYHAVNAEPIRP